MVKIEKLYRLQANYKQIYCNFHEVPLGTSTQHEKKMRISSDWHGLVN